MLALTAIALVAAGPLMRLLGDKVEAALRDEISRRVSLAAAKGDDIARDEA